MKLHNDTQMLFFRKSRETQKHHRFETKESRACEVDEKKNLYLGELNILAWGFKILKKTNVVHNTQQEWFFNFHRIRTFRIY